METPESNIDNSAGSPAEKRGLARANCKFDIWEDEVVDADTWAALQKQHRLNLDRVGIDVTMS